ncbi:MAG: hypothetical protein ACREVA_06620 [Burkholderiales bacterium]
MYGVLTDRSGRPVAVDVYPGCTADPTTVPDQVEKLKRRFVWKGCDSNRLRLGRVIRQSETARCSAKPKSRPSSNIQAGWISALRSEKLRQLVEQPAVRAVFVVRPKKFG